MRPHPGEIDENYDSFLTRGSWLNGFLYAAPAAIIFITLWFTGISEKFWTPVLIVYSIGAIAHMANYGFMGANVQTKISTDALIDELKLLKKQKILEEV